MESKSSVGGGLRSSESTACDVGSGSTAKRTVQSKTLNTGGSSQHFADPAHTGGASAAHEESSAGDKLPMDKEQLKQQASQKAAELKNRGIRNTRETSLAKWYACDVALQSADDAIQVHGSYGFSNEYPVERYMRNARGAVIYEGTREVHQLLQADYALGYREDKPLRCPQPPAVGFESEESREPALA